MVRIRSERGAHVVYSDTHQRWPKRDGSGQRVCAHQLHHGGRVHHRAILAPRSGLGRNKVDGTTSGQHEPLQELRCAHAHSRGCFCAVRDGKRTPTTTTRANPRHRPPIVDRFASPAPVSVGQAWAIVIRLYDRSHLVPRRAHHGPQPNPPRSTIHTQDLGRCGRCIRLGSERKHPRLHHQRVDHDISDLFQLHARISTLQTSCSNVPRRGGRAAWLAFAPCHVLLFLCTHRLTQIYFQWREPGSYWFSEIVYAILSLTSKLTLGLLLLINLLAMENANDGAAG